MENKKTNTLATERGIIFNISLLNDAYLTLFNDLIMSRSCRKTINKQGRSRRRKEKENNNYYSKKKKKENTNNNYNKRKRKTGARYSSKP